MAYNETAAGRLNATKACGRRLALKEDAETWLEKPKLPVYLLGDSPAAKAVTKCRDGIRNRRIASTNHPHLHIAHRHR